MTTGEQLRLSAIPASIDNVEEWDGIAHEIAAEAGVPTALTPEVIAAMIGSAVALLFEADETKDMNLLRGTFADRVIAQRQINAGCLQGAQPTSAVIDLVGVHMADGRPQLRLRVLIEVQGIDGSASVTSQFWDLELGGEVTVGQASCPNCGAPIDRGELICAHCRADVRSVVKLPLVVSRVELY